MVSRTKPVGRSIAHNGRKVASIHKHSNGVRLAGIVPDTVYFPCGKSVKSNFTFDLIFYIYEDSGKIGFHFFHCPKSKMTP